MKTYSTIGVQIPQILLPQPGIDLQKWSVIAVDQFTSQPEYWEDVQKLVGDAYSTFNLVLPEIYLEEYIVDTLIIKIQQNMKEYLARNVFLSNEHLIYIERCVDGKTRKGLMMALDLENYDYHAGSHTLIRATESTIVERIPPRLKIREGAALEIPHILILIDDPEFTVIEPIAKQKHNINKLYDFDLMMGSGHLSGYAVDIPQLEIQIIAALEKLKTSSSESGKQDFIEGTDELLFAVGDGNHSLATAKAFWEKIKPNVGLDHPARFVLVEVENIYDEGLEFEPIHRVLFNVEEDILNILKEYYQSSFDSKDCSDQSRMMLEIKNSESDKQVHRFGLITSSGSQIISIHNPSANLPLATLQPFLDNVMKDRKAHKIDYVHGDDVIFDLGIKPGNVGFYVPGIRKKDLFKTVIKDGSLPRKTFSMGHAKEKRFYMECRKIG